MHLPRTLTLLFLTVVGLMGLIDGLCHAQNTNYYPTADRSSKWLPTTAEFDAGTASAPSASSFALTYSPARIDSARRAADQYRRQYASSSPISASTTNSPASVIVSELANTNASFAEQWAELATTINSASARLVEANAKLKSVEEDYKHVETNLVRDGLTPTLGLLLSHKKSQLEDWQVAGSNGQSVNAEIQRSRDKQLANAMVKHNGSDVARQTAELLASSGYDSTRREYEVLTSQLQTLLGERREWLQLLAQGYNDYRQKLGELDSAAAAFKRLTVDYRTLIDRHVTWARSREPLGLADFKKLRSGLGSLFDPGRSEDFGYSLTQKWKNNPAAGLTLIGCTLIIFLLRILAKSWLIGIGSRKRMREASAHVRKFLASLLTPLVAFAFPSILYLLARWLGSGYVTESTLHVSSGLYAASLIALVVEVARQLLRRHGFVEKHLKIELPGQQRAAVYLLVIGTGLVLATYMVTLAAHIDHGSWSGSVARIGFISALLLVAWTAHLSLKPRGGFLEPLVEKFGGSVLYRIRILFYFLGVGFPLVMIGLSGLGYESAANEIIKRAGLMFVSLLVGATLWSAIKIVSSHAWHALTGTHDETRLDDYDPMPPARVSGAMAEYSLELKHQMAFLSRCGLVLGAVVCLGWLWSDVFPKVQLGNYVVWTIQDTVTKPSLALQGQTASRNEVVTTPITLLHLVLAGATMFVAFQLAKLLPALFDALVLQRVSFDEAMEHLSLVLGRFLLFGTGCFIACRLLGLRWETIQWLAVGLTIGIGFALQDILRNLFAGLVVMFEKPARLGDLITVGHVTGRVAAQKLRTTVLSDEKGRDVIIPNRNFVNQEVINWMGAGRLKVLPIEVAVTRDERPADVCRMLQQLLVEQPGLLLSPAPQATLICVSQQSQRIELRAWIEDDQDASRCRDSLMTTVLNYLAEKNLLAPQQPRQVLLNDSLDADAVAGFRSRRKRSA